MLGSLILYLKGMRIMMFQLSGFYGFYYIHLGGGVGKYLSSSCYIATWSLWAKVVIYSLHCSSFWGYLIGS